jgi:hypothetical protein
MNNVISNQPKKLNPITLKQFVKLKNKNLDIIESYQKANPVIKGECAGIDATILVSLLEYA